MAEIHGWSGPSTGQPSVPQRRAAKRRSYSWSSCHTRAACLMLHQQWECQLSCRHTTGTVGPDCVGSAGLQSHPFPAPTHSCHSLDLQVKSVMAFQYWLVCVAGNDAKTGHVNTHARTDTHTQQPGKLYACQVLCKGSWKLECRQNALHTKWTTVHESRCMCPGACAQVHVSRCMCPGACAQVHVPRCMCPGACAQVREGMRCNTSVRHSCTYNQACAVKFW